MVTSKAKRQPPPRIFEHYVLTRTTSPNAGLVDIPDIMFETSLGNPSVGFEDGDDVSELSDFVPIGFDFNFDGVTYTNIVVSTNGWLALADPAETVAANVQSSLMTTSYLNESINLTNTSQSVLLCPWFDHLRNLAQNTAETAGDVPNPVPQQYGITEPSPQYNNVEFATKIFRESNHQQGRRTIIRWNSLSNYENIFVSSEGQVVIPLKFEVVLYENGAIEFRYTPRRSYSTFGFDVSGFEDATIGIFASGTNRFRDFSLGLGYLDGDRQQYKYGGNAYDPSFVDNGLPYVWKLQIALNWPGINAMGSTFRFAPPQNRRKVLPRNLIRENDSRVESPLTYFDDRRAVSYVSGVIVNYPTTLQRFVGGEEDGVAQRQDLFGGSDTDFFVTGSVVRSAIEQFIERRDFATIQPFGEDNQFDQSPSARDDSFYSSGSGFDTGEQFNTPLWSKTQVEFSLPVNFATTLFDTKASIYYYNNKSKSWRLPANTVKDGWTDVANVNMFGNVVAPVIEDHRGFGPIGTVLTSGSHDVGFQEGTDEVFGSDYLTRTSTEALAKSYASSIFTTSSYEATPDETFTIPITQPLLIEKAVFKIPITVGAGWFEDRTTAWSVLNHSSYMPASDIAEQDIFDFAGPGLTVALLNQVKTGLGTRRDLIMTGTITHAGDLSSNVTPTYIGAFCGAPIALHPTGFLAYASEPGGVITAGADGTFTGSVIVKSEASITNGMIITGKRTFDGDPQSLIDVIDPAELTLGPGTRPLYYRVSYVDSFGRGASGFEPSGRSVLGKEFGTSQGVIRDGDKIDNPFHVTGSARSDLISAFAANSNTGLAVATISLIAHFRSPYLVMPGDKLILAFAKSRPYYYSLDLISTIYSVGGSGPEFRGDPLTYTGATNDVNLVTGAINVTLYGSQLREGKEFHDTLPRNLTSPAIREVICNDPTLDQFENAYRDEYIGGFADDYITGSMAMLGTSKRKTLFVVTGTRGRVFSKYDARQQVIPDIAKAQGTSNAGLRLPTNNSKAFRFSHYFEKVGTPRVVKYTDSTERFWDSLLPSINQCINANGREIFMSTYSGFGNFDRLDNTNVGFIVFNDPSGDKDLRDNHWTRSYPYEPRYARVTRQKVISKSFVARKLFINPDFVEIDPVQLKGLYFGPRTPRILGDTVAEDTGFYTWLCDADISVKNSNNFYQTSSAGLEDVTKALYGFGDLNTMFIGNNNRVFGTNHFAEFQNSDRPSGIVRFIYAPVIRGWKYGVWSGLPTYTQAAWRPQRFGQFRDMLEQRLFTKFFVLGSNDSGKTKRDTITVSPVQVKFIDALGNITAPENTQSSNLSFEATSSLPFLDGAVRNRNDINLNTQNANIVSFQSDQFNNVAL